MNTRPVVLIVEDIVAEQEKASALLLPHAEVLIAGWQREARMLLRSRTDINYILLDGYVPIFENEKLDTTYGLARELIRFLPSAQIYSASNDNDVNDKLAEIGAVRSNKRTAAGFVRDDILKNSGI